MDKPCRPFLKVSIYSEEDDFCQSRLNRIKILAGNANIYISEDRSIQYQQRLTFSDNEGHSTIITLWYNKNGYSNKEVTLRSNSEELESIARSLIRSSYVPIYIPFNEPERPFAEKLVEFLRTQFCETDIQLLNITHEKYQDVFHLKTDGLAKVCLYYTDKGNYTYMRLISSLGEMDKKLTEFRQRFI